MASLSLVNKTGKRSKEGHLAKVVQGGFEYCKAGDAPIGIVSKVQLPGRHTLIKSSGTVKAYVGKNVEVGDQLRQAIAGEGVPDGVLVPVGNATSYTYIGHALEKGKGLIDIFLDMSFKGSNAVTTNGPTGTITSHFDLTDIGSRTHAQIDAHIANITTNPHQVPGWDLHLGDTPAGGIFRETISPGNSLSFAGDGTWIGVNYDGANNVLSIELQNVTALDTRWNLSRADGQAATPRSYDTYIEIGNTAVVMFLDGQYTTTTTNRNLNFATDYTPNPGQPVNEVTIEVDTVTLRGHLDSYYYDFATYPSLATQTWVTSNFDNYTSWGIVDGIYTRDVISADKIEFVNGGDIQIQYDGYVAGVHTMTFTYVGTPGSMDRWYFNTDHVDSAKSIQNNAEVYLIGGTGIDLTEVTWNSTDLRWEMTIASTATASQWTTDTNGITYSAGNVGIGTASAAGYRLDVLGKTRLATGLIIEDLGGTTAYISSATGYDIRFNPAEDFGIGATIASNTYVTVRPGSSRTNVALFYTSSGADILTIGDSKSIGVSIAAPSDAILQVDADSTTNHVVKITGSAARAASRYALYIDDNDSNSRGSLYIDTTSGNSIETTSNIEVNGTIASPGHLKISNPGGTWAANNTLGELIFYSDDASGIGAREVGKVECFTDTPGASAGFGLRFYTGIYNGALTEALEIQDDQNAYFAAGVYAVGEVESYDTSDISLKANIQDIELERARQLLEARTVEYDHKKKDRHEVGLIAQEIKEIFPENVKEDGEGKLMIHYGKMIAPLLALIKDQEKRIKELENGARSK